MKTKFSGILTLLLAFVVHLTYAQDKTISGTVSDESGMPLPGVNIIVKGTTNGTQTDFDGNYSISTSTGSTLTFTYVGYKTVEQVVGTSNTINVKMAEDVSELEEVVVTAQGIKKEKKALGYAVSEVKSKDIEQKSDGDIGRILRGKAAGVNITASNGLSGSATNIVIRGYTSITGSNQPLFIVDGIPYGSDTNSQSAFFDNTTESSRFLDLDPNNIASVNVLKGLSATTLYGSRGRNGVVLITTKTGSAKDSKGKANLSISSSVFFSDPHLPDYQDDYGGGFNQTFGWFFSNWGPSFSDTNEAAFGGFYNSTSNGTIYVNHPITHSTNPEIVEEFADLVGTPYEYKPYNSVEDFFRTGVMQTLNVSLDGGNSDYGYSVNYGKMEEEGFTPGNSIARDNISIGGRATKGKLKVNGTLNYSKVGYKSPPIAASAGSGAIGDGASLFGDLMYTPRNVNLQGLPFERPGGGSVYYRTSNDIQNPLWTVKNSKTGQEVNRITSNLGFSYDFSESLSVNYRYGIDTYTENSFYAQNRGGIDGETQGMYRTTNVVSTIKDHTFSFNYNTDITENFDIRAVVGFNSNGREYDRDGLESSKQIVFGVQRHYNFTDVSSENSFSGNKFQNTTRVNQVGVYGDVTLGFKNYLFFNAALRHDWSSTLEEINNSVTYPSTSISFLPTSAIEGLQSQKGLNYMKLRLGYGTSAGFPDAYNTRTVLGLDGRTFVDADGTLISSNSTGNFRGNPDLKPELISEIEFGMDTKFLDNRFTLNTSIFKKQTEDLLTYKDLDPSTGYTQTQINGGSLEVVGLELDFGAEILRSDNEGGLNWGINATFYADESEITSLPDGIDRIYIGSRGYTDDAANAAVVGQPYGVFLGTAVQRDDNGNMIVGADGNYLETADNTNIIGDPNPDWTSTFSTNVSYKGFTLGASIGYRHGGDIFSYTTATLINRGLVDFPVDRNHTIILPGVTQDGSVNTTQINATDLAFSNWLYGATEFKIFDGSTIRLNEVSLSYDLPNKLITKTPFTGISFKISGSNLWYKAVNMPEGVNFDTNSLSTGVGNNIGLEYLTGPSAKRYGFSLKLNL
ncbi:MAG: SusC/RagA family TonB-linked outer membrane protein [Flavobacteriaceae bacterium]|nr:SusC/RagA family TonB-linked outer membrane protein [Flavobacteriaceae bacterium]